MKVLVTGNLGYVGTVLVPLLQEKGHEVAGLDSGFFSECTLASPISPNRQLIKDTRNVSVADFEGIDAVVHLAALSNDPLGELAPGLTEEINLDATMSVAMCAKEAGVKRFVYASSQSMYGVSNTDAELDEYQSEKKPETAYARTKWQAELKLGELNSDQFTVCCFRPSTVFGASPRLRCDIVFNNLVACAYTTNKIEIKSDGTPWRPVVHVRDVCAAFIAGVEAPREIVSGKSYNVGIKNGNFTVRQLAEAAQKAVPSSELVFTGEHGGDARTYRVCFDRILRELGEFYKPEWTLDKGAEELVEFFNENNFSEKDFRGWKTTRLMHLNAMLETGRMSKDFRLV